MAPERIEDEITKRDKKRANYYNYHATEKWGRAENYDLALKSSVLGVDGSVELLADFVSKA
jgi:hypothetical protein